MGHNGKATSMQRWRMYQQFLRTLMTDREALAVERSVRPEFDRLEASRERLRYRYPLMRDAQIDQLLCAADANPRA